MQLECAREGFIGFIACPQQPVPAARLKLQSAKFITFLTGHEALSRFRNPLIIFNHQTKQGRVFPTSFSDESTSCKQIPMMNTLLWRYRRPILHPRPGFSFALFPGSKSFVLKGLSTGQSQVSRLGTSDSLPQRRSPVHEAITVGGCVATRCVNSWPDRVASNLGRQARNTVGVDTS